MSLPLRLLRCPRCRGELDRDGGEAAAALACAACGSGYPIVAGIPDLRIFADPYIGLEEDRDKAGELAARLDDFDFAGLVDHYYRSTPAVPPHHARLYARGLETAAGRAEAFLTLLEGPADESAAGPFLDLGCGTAPLALAAARRGHEVIGVDIALRWLVVARKRLAEAGIETPLVCACAEALPFPGAAFARIGAESVIDQLGDRAAALAECHRALAPGGRLLLSTPNRLSLGPDPQTGLWAASWLPERAVAAIVRRQGGIPPRRRLLTAGDLRRALAAAGLEPSPIVLPRITAGQRRHLSPPLRLAAALYSAARALPAASHLLRAIGPLLCAAARKPAAETA